jgi:hypothetical protein
VKAKVQAVVKINAYEIIARAVEEGVAYGYRRAHKYTDKPTEDALCQEIAQAVTGELCEVLKFED